MGLKASRARQQTIRRISPPPVSNQMRALLQGASYQGSPLHKAAPGDFGLIPPASPRPDKTLCDEARIRSLVEANALFREAIQNGLVSVATVPGGYPKQLWVVDEGGRVFEAMYGGPGAGYYHGYPIRDDDPLSDEVRKYWAQRP